MKKVKGKSLNQFQLIGGLSVLSALSLSGTASAMEPFKASEHLTGDWGGLRQELYDKG
jgi:porin